MNVDVWADELDRIIGRVIANDARLVLERESDKWWTVTDTANDVVMVRASREVCVRFMRAFVVKHPTASFDRAEIEHSWRVAQSLGLECPASASASEEAERDPDAQPQEHCANVVPIR